MEQFIFDRCYYYIDSYNDREPDMFKCTRSRVAESAIVAKRDFVFQCGSCDSFCVFNTVQPIDLSEFWVRLPAWDWPRELPAAFQCRLARESLKRSVSDLIGSRFAFLNLTLFNVSDPVACAARNTSLWGNVSDGLLDVEPDKVSAFDFSDLDEYNWYYLFAMVFMCSGILGNLLVCLAVIFDKALHKNTNYFLLSLALADLLVCMEVMPLGAIQGFFDGWPLGVSVCNVYVTTDVLACSSSIMHMCFISLDRYFGIRNPLRTRHTSTNSMVLIKIVLVWFLSGCVSIIITILGVTDPQNIMPNDRHCAINNRGFLIFGSLVAFYIPLVVMIVSYGLTVKALYKKIRMAKEQSNSEEFLGGRIMIKPLKTDRTTSHSKSSLNLPLKSHVTYINENITSKIGLSAIPEAGSEHENGVKFKLIRSNNSTETNDFSKDSNSDYDVEMQQAKRRQAQGLGPVKAPFNWIKSHISAKNFFYGNQSNDELGIYNVAYERKATKVLGIVFIVFTVFWCPFFLMNIVLALCQKCHVPNGIVEIFLWLGYFSSTINPIIYTIFNKQFRAAFISLLSCRRPNSNQQKYRSVLARRSPIATLSSHSVHQNFLEQQQSLKSTPENGTDVPLNDATSGIPSTSTTLENFEVETPLTDDFLVTVEVHKY